MTHVACIYGIFNSLHRAFIAGYCSTLRRQYCPYHVDDITLPFTCPATLDAVKGFFHRILKEEEKNKLHEQGKSNQLKCHYASEVGAWTSFLKNIIDECKLQRTVPVAHTLIYLLYLSNREDGISYPHLTSPLLFSRYRVGVDSVPLSLLLPDRSLRAFLQL